MAMDKGQQLSEMEELTISAQLSRAAFEALQNTKSGRKVHQCVELHLDSLIEVRTDPRYVEMYLAASVNVAYTSIVNTADIDTAIAAASAKFKWIQSLYLDKAVQLEAKAFQAPYLGDADAQFREYLAACCSAYRKYTTEYACPLLVLTQSSGFGKSRILRQVKAFDYSVEHSDAGDQWKVLLDNWRGNKTLDKHIVEEIVDASKRQQPGSPSLWHRLEVRAKAPVLVVAIDKAWALHGVKNSSGIDALEMLCEALNTVNTFVAVTRTTGAVFAVLVDSSPHLHDAILDSYARRRSGNKALFPPFILTQTMDVMLSTSGNLSSSQSRVLCTDAEQTWEALVSMGRPLWRSMKQGDTLKGKQKALNLLAASKLLLGLRADNAASYNDDTLYGMASLVCRVGLCLRGCDPVATRLVADLMSVLHYVTHKSDAHISSYASEPVLTFGVSRIWYQLEPPALASHILPQFQAMLAKAVVDTGNIGEVVTRIFLLLAMDATIMGEEVMHSAVERKKFVFTGQFGSVSSFVAMLVGENPHLIGNDALANFDTEEGKAKYDDWLQRWANWKVSFSHFVDLPKDPSDEVLWKLLDRRAAGILPRGQRGARLVLPIFSGEQASFILVQVKDRVDQDDKFPVELASLEPQTVFDSTHPLYNFPPRNMIRLFMSGSEFPRADPPAQYVVVDAVTPKDKPPQLDCSLCVRGVFGSVDSDGNETQTRWPFLSPKLAKQLQVLTNSEWWDCKTQVQFDLDNQGSDESAQSRVLPKDVALKRAGVALDLF